MAEQNRFQQPWNIWQATKLRLNGDAWDKSNPKERPNVSLHVVNNNPRFRLYMNNGKVQKPIAFALDPFILEGLFSALVSICDDNNPNRYTLELKAYYDHHGNHSDKPTSVSKIMVGRDSNGIVYIAFQAKGEDIAKFSFISSYYAVLLGSNGESLDVVKASEFMAKGWIRLLSNMVSSYLVVEGKEPPPKKDNNNYNNNNNQNNNQSNQQSNQQNNSNSGGSWKPDDDIPFS